MEPQILIEHGRLPSRCTGVHLQLLSSPIWSPKIDLSHLPLWLWRSPSQPKAKQQGYTAWSVHAVSTFALCMQLVLAVFPPCQYCFFVIRSSRCWAQLLQNCSPEDVKMRRLGMGKCGISHNKLGTVWYILCKMHGILRGVSNFQTVWFPCSVRMGSTVPVPRIGVSLCSGEVH